MDIIFNELFVLPLLLMAALVIRAHKYNAKLRREVAQKEAELKFMITVFLEGQETRAETQEVAKERSEEYSGPPSDLPEATARFKR